MEYVFDAMVARRESCLEDGMFENTFDHEQSERERNRRVYLTSLFSLDSKEVRHSILSRINPKKVFKRGANYPFNAIKRE